MNRRKFRDLFGDATIDVDIREAVVELTASVAPARMTAVLDSPLRLQWDAQSASWLVSGFRLRAVFDALQEFLAGRGARADRPRADRVRARRAR